MERLIIFIKAARPGTVKTRLARTIGAEAACSAYRSLISIVVSNLAGFTGVELRYAPDDALEEIHPWLKSGWQARPQGAGDLGERLRRAFDDAFQNGAARTVVIGSDCPEVTMADIEAAWSELENFDVVLGPARDGGYWLIGLRQPQAQLFQGIPWSTDSVLRETLARAQDAGLRVHLLRQLFDIDTESDWHEFRQRPPR